MSIREEFMSHFVSKLAKFCQEDPELLLATSYKVVEVTDPDKVALTIWAQRAAANNSVAAPTDKAKSRLSKVRLDEAM